MTRAAMIRQGPYRLLFPLGLLCGLIGVGHWLFWSIGWVEESRSFFHASIQIQGFLTCFVVGFLMTALPRFLGAAPARISEVAGAIAWIVVFMACAWGGRHSAAQAAFLALLGWTVLFAGRRFPVRTQPPPDSFVLIGFGLGHAFLGSALMIAGQWPPVGEGALAIGRAMMQLGYGLCLVLGITGHLAPFLMGYAQDPRADPKTLPRRGARASAIAAHALAGMLIGISFLLDETHPSWAAGLRAVVVSAHALTYARLARRPRNRSVPAFFFWIACWMIPIGLWTAFLWPDFRIAGLHGVFIGGFSLLIFSFGLLVILSHGPSPDHLQGPLIPLKLIGAAVLIAVLLRAAADVDAWHYKAWIHAASGTWLLAAALWLIYLWPKLWRAPAPE